MSDEQNEEIERVRQQVMRTRELLTIMRERLLAGERAYEALFARVAEGIPAGTREKDAQRLVAIALGGDTAPIAAIAGRMRFEAHELERAFEELQLIIERQP